MKLNNEDIDRLITACRSYVTTSGSEYIWDQYHQLIDKLKTYKEQHSTDVQTAK
jgi:hypothetical protein